MTASIQPKKDASIRAELTDAHREYEKALRSRALFKTNDVSKSEDLVQATFMKTWAYLVKGGEVATMKAFLYHVLNGLIIDEYRKHQTSSLDVMLEKGFSPEYDDSERLVNVLDGKEAVLLIKRISPKYQKVMRMKYVQGLSLSEMALITGQTKNTIAVQAHRGLIELRALYNRESDNA